MSEGIELFFKTFSRTVFKPILSICYSKGKHKNSKHKQNGKKTISAKEKQMGNLQITGITHDLEFVCICVTVNLSQIFQVLYTTKVWLRILLNIT